MTYFANNHLCLIFLEFDTSKLEMNAVADMFDHDKLGLIDWKEFIAALRPDWEEKKPDTESEMIHDEVKRLVMLCTCRQKFRVFQVGEGKYRVWNRNFHCRLCCNMSSYLFLLYHNSLVTVKNSVLSGYCDRPSWCELAVVGLRLMNF